MNPFNKPPANGPKLTLVPTGPEASQRDEEETTHTDNIATLPLADQTGKLRIIEALLFQSTAPMTEAQLAEHLEAGTDIATLLRELQAYYANRGINLVRVSGKWAFRTATDLSYLLERHSVTERRLSKAALETLAIVAYHQPVTRAEIEDIRGVSTSAGTLNILLETGWIRPRGRRRAPGRPVTYGTTERFLENFNLDSIRDLPGLSELKGAGLLDSTLPTGFSMPEPKDVAALMPDELPLDAEDEDTEEQSEMDLPLRDADDPESVDESGASTS